MAELPMLVHVHCVILADLTVELREWSERASGDAG
jgi:hypothetical protein